MLIARALKYFLQGRIHFDRNVIGKIIKEDDDYVKILVDFRVTMNGIQLEPHKNIGIHYQ